MSNHEKDFDPITREVIKNRLDAIVEEMQTTVLRVAHSSIVRDAHDATAALFDIRGNTLAQASAVPAHLQMMIPVIASIIREIPPETMKDGDLYTMNDPYNGGTHLPDFVVAMPIFSDQGKPIAISACMLHHQDVGGPTPGSTSPSARDIFAEGIVVPVQKLYKAGCRNDGLVKLLCRNVRLPEPFEGDLMAQVACCKIGATRTRQMLVEFGADETLRYWELLLDYAEALTRSAFESMPDGEYEFYDFIDGDGVNIHSPVMINVKVTVSGSNLHADFMGTDPQATGSMNCVPATTGAGVFFVARAICGPDVPNNGGAYRPISMSLPEGTIVNPRYPAAIGTRTITLRRIAGTMLGALFRAMPDRMPAAPEGASNFLFVGGVDPKDQQRFVTWFGIPTVGGTGGRPHQDGIAVISHDTSNVRRFPAEAFELGYPFRVVKCDLWTDSGGPGRWRGGLGYHSIVEVCRGGPYTLSIRRDRHDFAPWGVMGGSAAPLNRIVLHSKKNGTREMPSTEVIEIMEGDRLECFTTGGGGYGDPLDREAWRVRDDVLDFAVSAEQAAKAYGVVLSGEALAIDEDATAQLRAKLKEDRGPANWTFDRGETFTSRTGGLARYQ